VVARGGTVSVGTAGGGDERELRPRQSADIPYGFGRQRHADLGRHGNLISDGVRSYTWDARNRLTAIPSVASFVYDFRAPADGDARRHRYFIPV